MSEQNPVVLELRKLMHGESRPSWANRAADEIEKLEQQRDELQAKYSELLYAVESKHPNESRHETALRYIKDREMAKAIAWIGGSAQGAV